MQQGNEKQSEGTTKCIIIGEEVPLDLTIQCSQLDASLLRFLESTRPDLTPDSRISQSGLLKLRMQKVESDLESELGSLSEKEKEVIDALKEGRYLATDPLQDMDEAAPFAQRLADKIAAFGGSWTFILSFLGLLTFWIILNTGLLFTRPFDPYPFILMNLILSCIAALQAPVIMMSQNRQETKDRARSEHDYQINLKAELEIRALREQMDRFTSHQWAGLLEIQKIQMEMLETLSRRDSPPQDKSE